jgi:uncharacterized membrane protein YgdD (TMEM256/DUF423 family)
MSERILNATRIHCLVAALFGALGIGALAAGSHVAGPQMTLAGQLLLFHASGLIAAATARKAGLLHDRTAQIGMALMAAGVTLFAADMAVRGLYGVRLFPLAAPIGGMVTIGGWLELGLAALLAPRKP